MTHIRLRQLEKVVSPEEFWELKHEYTHNDRCPLCNAELWKQSWSEDGPGGYGCVETDERCRQCEYYRNWSYGLTSLTVGKWYGEYCFRSGHREVKQIEKEFCRQIKLFKDLKKSARQKYYRKVRNRA